MGFHPPELSPRVESKHPFGAPALLPLAAANGSASRLRTKRGSVAGAPLFRNHASSLLSWAFIPSRVFPFAAIGPQKSPSSHDLIHSRLTVSSADGLQSLTRGKVGLALSSLPTLLGSCASTLDHLLLFRPCRNHFFRSHHPINEMSETASAALSGLPNDWLSNASATNPSDSHRPRPQAITSRSGVKHLFGGNIYVRHNS